MIAGDVKHNLQFRTHARRHYRNAGVLACISRRM